MERSLIYEEQRDWRCLKCNALLSKYRGAPNEATNPFWIWEIRCRRCAAMNQMTLPEGKASCLIS